jgi:hypothetical protein
VKAGHVPPEQMQRWLGNSNGGLPSGKDNGPACHLASKQT